MRTLLASDGAWLADGVVMLPPASVLLASEAMPDIDKRPELVFFPEYYTFIKILIC